MENVWRWRYGDVVRVERHRDPRVVGTVFRVEEYSSMDFIEDWPRIRNPYPGPIGPIYISFNPDDLVEANVLERLSVLGKKK